ncbi:MAG: lipopolysaccharide biosynthesis protein [Nonlabens sp.]
MQKIYKDLQNGSFYFFLAKYSNLFFQLLVTSILARLIPPTEFGVIAIAMVFILFFNQLSDAGLGTAIIQKRELTDQHLSTYFIFTFIQGLVLLCIFNLCVPLIDRFYTEIELNVILHTLSVSIFFFSAATVPQALISKAKRFKELGYIAVVTNLFTGIVAIVLSLYLNEKVYALIIKVLLDAIISFIWILIISRFSPKLIFKKSALKEVFSYSAFQFLHNFIHYFSRNVDNLVIGKYLGAGPLGFYDKAYRLMIMPIQNLTHVITPVMHPVLSAFQDDKSSVVKVYENVVRLLAIIGFPLSVYLFFSAREIIQIVFGPDWIESIIPFKFLALSIGFQMLISSTKSIFQTANETRSLFYSTLISLIVLLILMVFGITYDYNLNNFSKLILLHYLVSFVIVFYFLFKIVLETRIHHFIKLLVNPIIISISIGLVFYVIPLEISNVFYSILVKSCIFIATYMVVSLILNETFLIKSLRKIIANFKMN